MTAVVRCSSPVLAALFRAPSIASTKREVGVSTELVPPFPPERSDKAPDGAPVKPAKGPAAMSYLAPDASDADVDAFVDRLKSRQ